jgi:hypothetical protein
LRRAVVMALFYVGIDWLPDMADLLSFVWFLPSSFKIVRIS